MNEEEKKKILEIAKEIGYKVGTYCNDEEIEVFEKFLEDYKYKSNLVEKQQAEIEKKDTLINTMQAEFERLENLEDNTDMLKMELEKKDKIIDLILEEMVNNHCSIRDIVEEEICDDRCVGNNNWTCFKHIKEYFEKKVEAEYKIKEDK